MLSKKKSLLKKLAKAADIAIGSAISHGGVGFSAPGNYPIFVNSPSDEPSAVAALMLVGIPNLAHGWSKLLQPRGYRVEITAVFCHKSPQVKFVDSSGKKEKCELADLLIVMDHTTKSNFTDRRAVLVQAKKVKSSSRVSTAKAKHQLDLYCRWPRFKFASKQYNPIERDFISPKKLGSATNSGRYGAIDLGASPVSWTQVIPSAVMSTSGAPGLAEFLAGMAVGLKNVGRKTRFCAAPSKIDSQLTPDHWSATVEELREVAFRTRFRLKVSVGPVSPARATSALAYYASVDFADPMLEYLTLQGTAVDGWMWKLAPPDKVAPEEFPEEEGINTIHIKINRGE